MKTCSKPNSSQYSYGIFLSEFEKESIKKHLDSLRERAPAYCRIELLFTEESDRYKGVMRIISPQRTFTAKAFGATPLSVYRKLEKRIDEDLMNWKQERCLTHLPFSESPKIQGGIRL